MFNPAVKAYKNIRMPKEKSNPTNSGGLLAREVKQKQDTKTLDPQKRIANYVLEIRKARQGLKNG